MEPWQSWAIVIAGGGLAYAYYNNQNKPKAGKARASSISEPTPSQSKTSKKKEDKQPKKKIDGTSASEPSGSEAPKLDSKLASGAEAGKKRKAGNKKNAPSTPAPPVVAVSKEEPEAEDDNKAWAEQLASLKKGTSLAPPVRNDSRNRTVKQSAVNAGSGVSSASSTGGADADDDLSPAISPSLGARDVSDMLEPRASGPSVLRLTEPSRPQQTRQARPQKDFETAESKKQRQNRRKVEERRLEREAAEKEQKALLERQRKTAREARGEPAKNGVPVSKPPAVSAWDAPAARSEPRSTSTAPLLDTFDHDAESNSSSVDALNNSTAATSTTTSWEPELPSQEDESGWNTVPKGKKQKKQVVAGESEASDLRSARPTPVEKPAPPAPKVSQAKVNGYSYLDQVPEIDAGSHPDDSEWTA